MASELGASQISTLLETLPGIANVLRSPVADAMLNVIRAGARLSEFQLADAEELIRYATRRNLLGTEEGERVLAEVREACSAARRRRPRRRRRRPRTRPSRRPRPRLPPRSRRPRRRDRKGPAHAGPFRLVGAARGRPFRFRD
ncbi:MAG: hypothetical protein IPK12_07070 [Gemmatimonadetes bacterium]|nr:hypothetical protein [Gemmatimonadota bacterium]